MGLPAAGSVVMKDFSGLASKPDADDLTPGASQVQINAISANPGELRVRSGYQVLTFEEE